jgi:hypothetical protein
MVFPCFGFYLYMFKMMFEWSLFVALSQYIVFDSHAACQQTLYVVIAV